MSLNASEGFKIFPRVPAIEKKPEEVGEPGLRIDRGPLAATIRAAGQPGFSAKGRYRARRARGRC